MMVYGVLRFINFALCVVFLVGAFCGYYLARLFPNQTIFTSLMILLASMIICAVLGMIIEKLAYRPLRNRSTLTVLITAIGVTLILQNVGQAVFGPNPKAYPPLFPQKNILLFGAVTISSNQIVVLVVTLLLLWALRHI